jgi:hypothetical protein
MSAPISVPCAPNADAFGDDPSTQVCKDMKTLEKSCSLEDVF